jgi:hypothetical protein
MKSTVLNLHPRLSTASPGLAGWAANFAMVTILISQGLHPDPSLHPDMPSESSPKAPFKAVIMQVSSTASTATIPILRA